MEQCTYIGKCQRAVKQIKDKGYIGDQHENGWISCSCIRQWLRKEYNINIYSMTNSDDRNKKLDAFPPSTKEVAVYAL